MTIADKTLPSASYCTGYSLYLPDFSINADTPWPLLVFLHGMGERGCDLNLVKKNGPLCRIIKDNESFPFVIFAPQCAVGLWWHSETIIALIDNVIGAYNIDVKRIYLTGISMGGSGVWKLASEHRNRFAAIAPVCSFFTPLDPETLTSMPIWCFHGALDADVPVTDSIRMLNWIMKKSQNPNVQLTIFPDLGHHCWREVYKNKELYNWFLKFKN